MQANLSFPSKGMSYTIYLTRSQAFAVDAAIVRVTRPTASTISRPRRLAGACLTVLHGSVTSRERLGSCIQLCIQTVVASNDN